MSKTFAVGGVSKSKSGYKVRFAADMTRVKILAKTDTDVQLMELPRAMTKLEALQYLQEQGITAGDAGFAVANKLAEKTKVAKKGEVKVSAKSAKPKAKVAPATVKADAVESTNA